MIPAILATISIALCCASALVAFRWWLAFRREERPPAPVVYDGMAKLEERLLLVEQELTGIRMAKALGGR